MSHEYENRLWATLHLTHESLWIMVENGTKTCTFQVTMCKKWLGSEKVRRKLCSSQKEFHSQPFQAAELYTCGQNDSNGHVNFAWAIGDAKDERGSLCCLCRSRKYQPRFLAKRRERPHVSVLLGTFFDLQHDSDGWWDHTLVWSWSLIFIRMSPQHFQNWWTKGGSFTRGEHVRKMVRIQAPGLSFSVQRSINSSWIDFWCPDREFDMQQIEGHVLK